MKSNNIRKSSGSVRGPLPGNKTASRGTPFYLRATNAAGFVGHFIRLFDLFKYDQLSLRLRREAEIAARRGDRGASDFLAELRQEQEFTA